MNKTKLVVTTILSAAIALPALAQRAPVERPARDIEKDAAGANRKGAVQRTSRANEKMRRSRQKSSNDVTAGESRVIEAGRIESSKGTKADIAASESTAHQRAFNQYVTSVLDRTAAASSLCDLTARQRNPISSNAGERLSNPTKLSQSKLAVQSYYKLLQDAGVAIDAAALKDNQLAEDLYVRLTTMVKSFAAEQAAKGAKGISTAKLEEGTVMVISAFKSATEELLGANGRLIKQADGTFKDQLDDSILSVDEVRDLLWNEVVAKLVEQGVPLERAQKVATNCRQAFL